MFGLLVEFVVVLCDGAFLSRYDANSFNAAGIGGMLYLSLFMLGLGLSSGAQIIIARRAGAGKLAEVGKVFRHVGLLLFVTGLLLLFLFRYVAPAAMAQFMQSKQMADAVVLFAHYRGFGFLSGFGYLALTALFTGTGCTNVLVLFSLITAITNIVLDYALIFGHWGFPEMGIEGAALASFLAESTAFLVGLGYIILHPQLRPYEIWSSFRPSISVFQRLLKVSLPLVGQHFLSFTGWFLFFALIEQLGETSFQASNVVRHLYLLLFIPILGFSSVTQTYVSNLLGAGQSDLIPTTVRRIVWMTITGTLILLGSLLIFPATYLSILTDTPEVVDLSIRIIYVISPALFIFSVTFIVFAVISGSGNTRQALIIESTVILSYLVVTYFLAIIWPQPVEWIWASEYVYFGLMGILSWVYLRKGTWKLKQI